MTEYIKQRIAQIQVGKVPQGYKKTKMGILPSEWEVKTIKQLIEKKYISPPNDGNHGELHPSSAEYVNEGIPFLMASDVQNDKIDLFNCKFITKERAEKLQKGFARNGDILFTHKGSVGNVALLNSVITEYVMLTPQVTYYRILNKKIISANFLKNYLQSHDFQKDLKIKSKGATRDYIGIVEQQKLLIVLLPFQEQEKIADILTIYDKVIELKEKLIVQKKEHKKWLIQNLLTGRKRLSGFTDEWKKIKLRDFIKEIKDKTIESNQYDILSVTKNGIVKQSEHFNKQIASDDNTGYKILRRGNLAFSTMNLWMGSVDVLDEYEIGIISPAYKVFNFIERNMIIDFGKHYMKSTYMVCIYNMNSEQGASIVRKNLDMDGLFNTKVSVPSLPEQIAIANILSTADLEIKLLQKDLNQWKQKKKVLMQLLLTGKVRVK